MLKTIFLIILLINYFAYSLKSNDVCIKRVECNGNNCGLSNCKGILSYECSRMECSINEQTCEEYQEIIRYLDLRKNIKMDKLKTLGTMRGLSFVTKNLRKFETLRNNIEECSIFD